MAPLAVVSSDFGNATSRVPAEIASPALTACQRLLSFFTNPPNTALTLATSLSPWPALTWRVDTWRQKTKYPQARTGLNRHIVFMYDCGEMGCSLCEDYAIENEREHKGKPFPTFFDDFVVSHSPKNENSL